jgi:hypothetical protein
MLSVSDVDLMTSVVFTSISDVVPTGCVGCPCFAY